MKIWGILNLTPDSFYAGSRLDEHNLLCRAEEFLQQGADVLDLGAESTRPYAETISAEEEWQRLKAPLLALKNLLGKEFSSRVSVDSRKAVVVGRALELGVGIINDVGSARDRQLVQAVIEARASYVLMHSQGEPGNMQNNPVYGDVVTEVHDFLTTESERLLSLGMLKENLIWDYGIGFGKSTGHNLALLKNSGRFRGEFPLLAGVSRKSFIGRLLNLPDPADRAFPSLALHSYLALQEVDILRVHDVKETAWMRTLFSHLQNT